MRARGGCLFRTEVRWVPEVMAEAGGGEWGVGRGGTLGDFVWATKGKCGCAMLMGTSCSADEVSAIVVDVGYTNTKAGFAGEDNPKAVFPSVRPMPSLRVFSLLQAPHAMSRHVQAREWPLQEE